MKELHLLSGIGGGWVRPTEVRALLTQHHYLGPTNRGDAWVDTAGCMVFASPTSRRLPTNWLDLTRWCIVSQEPNAGSSQWGRVRRSLLQRFPSITTVVSYSDPSAGHRGALYRACNWWWAPTWHRLRPPPTGQGSWDGHKQQAVKDRWVFALRPDPNREAILVAKDAAVLKRMPFTRYQEPGGAGFKQWLAATTTPGQPATTPPQLDVMAQSKP